MSIRLNSSLYISGLIQKVKDRKENEGTDQIRSERVRRSETIVLGKARLKNFDHD